MKPTQEHIDRAIELRDNIICISRAIEAMGVTSADLRHAVIKLASAERGMDDFIAKARKGEVE
jgi:hypothetical protein